jgi:hypothetical protein
VKSDFIAWKREVQSYFLYYYKEYVNNGDQISWMKEILKAKLFRSYQARTQYVVDLYAQDTWIADRQSAEAQFFNGT